ncbi:MAG: winged helix-turn-helix transcriptional regulator [Methanocorpusculum parvum]|nr:winged helix-turn-helix transcriptional regulator [Methanocorpusculum parvum]
MHLRLFLVVLILSALFVMPAAGDLEGVVHYPISGFTVMPGDSDFVSDETDHPIVEVTEFKFSIPYVVFLFTALFDIHDVPVWVSETIVIIIGIFTTIITLITSGYLIILYSKRKTSDNPKSRHIQILSYLSEHPGVSETDIVNATGFSRGSVSYNLRKLLQDGSVSKISSRYYPFAVCPAETEAKAEKILGNKRRQRIFQIILENPRISQKQLADEMQIPLSTLRWHLGKLADANLIQIEAKQHTLCYSVNPDFSKQDE